MRSQYCPWLSPKDAPITTAGCRRLDFWGISAGSDLHRCTSVFYRDGNVLGL